MSVWSLFSTIFTKWTVTPTPLFSVPVSHVLNPAPTCLTDGLVKKTHSPTFQSILSGTPLQVYLLFCQAPLRICREIFIQESRTLNFIHTLQRDHESVVGKGNKIQGPTALCPSHNAGPRGLWVPPSAPSFRVVFSASEPAVLALQGTAVQLHAGIRVCGTLSRGVST